MISQEKRATLGPVLKMLPKLLAAAKGAGPRAVKATIPRLTRAVGAAKALPGPVKNILGRSAWGAGGYGYGKWLTRDEKGVTPVTRKYVPLVSGLTSALFGPNLIKNYRAGKPLSTFGNITAMGTIPAYHATLGDITKKDLAPAFDVSRDIGKAIGDIAAARPGTRGAETGKVMGVAGGEVMSRLIKDFGPRGREIWANIQRRLPALAIAGGGALLGGTLARGLLPSPDIPDRGSEAEAEAYYRQRMIRRIMALLATAGAGYGAYRLARGMQTPKQAEDAKEAAISPRLLSLLKNPGVYRALTGLTAGGLSYATTKPEQHPIARYGGPITVGATSAAFGPKLISKLMSRGGWKPTAKLLAAGLPTIAASQYLTQNTGFPGQKKDIAKWVGKNVAAPGASWAADTRPGRAGMRWLDPTIPTVEKAPNFTQHVKSNLMGVGKNIGGEMLKSLGVGAAVGLPAWLLVRNMMRKPVLPKGNSFRDAERYADEKAKRARTIALIAIAAGLAGTGAYAYRKQIDRGLKGMFSKMLPAGGNVSKSVQRQVARSKKHRKMQQMNPAQKKEYLQKLLRQMNEG